MKLKLTLLFFLMSSLSHACEFAQVQFIDDFAGARLNQCQKLGENSFLLTIDPENRPINPSPWYAFKIVSQTQQELKLTLDFGKDKSRYLPKVSHDGIHWDVVEHQVNQGDLQLELTVSDQPVWLASQEVIDNQFYQRWLNAIESQYGLKPEIIGYSEQKRPIWAIKSRQIGKEWVVVTGRMHPPEVTGAMALFPFVETLLAATNKAFLARFNLLIIPNMNPDGVALGYWRHNFNGKDLNRDWKTFQQAETQVVRDQLEAIAAKGERLVYAIDFHSTSKNIFYSMPEDYGLFPKDMTARWLNHLDGLTPDMKVVIKPGNNPDKGVFKQYIADRFKVHAITYEMADEFSRERIIEVANKAALSFMEIFLSTAASEFNPQSE